MVKIFTFGKLVEYNEYLDNIDNLTLDELNKMENLWKDAIIVEGMLYTQPPDKTIRILQKRLKSLNFDLTEFNHIYINDVNTLTPYDIKLVKSLIQNLGWLISMIKYSDDDNYIIYDKDNEDSKLENMNIDSIIIEPIKDIRGITPPKILYHVTLKKNVPRILKIGLIPKALNKKSRHPDRIYLTDKLSVAFGIMKEFSNIEFGKYKPEMYDILEIDTDGLVNTLYFDTNFEANAYYTTHNIPPTNITIVD
jgi:hypothetical protein